MLQCAEPIFFVESTSGSDMTRSDFGRSTVSRNRRFAGSEMRFEIRRPADGSSQRIFIAESRVLLVVAIANPVGVTAGGFAAEIAPDHLAILAKPGAVDLDGPQGAACVVFDIDRSAIQIAATRLLQRPVRLAARNCVLDAPISGTSLGRMVFDSYRKAALFENTNDFRMRLAEQVAARLRVDPFAGVSLRPALTVTRAIDHVAQHVGTRIDAATLAAATGVTARTLRTAFLTIMGVPVAAYVRDAQLRHARDRLNKAQDSRRIADIAHAAGFASAAAFTRAYQRLFNESPTETRISGTKGHF
jgi:AraC-like DNA-binding protein